MRLDTGNRSFLWLLVAGVALHLAAAAGACVLLSLLLIELGSEGFAAFGSTLWVILPAGIFLGLLGASGVLGIRSLGAQVAASRRLARRIDGLTRPSPGRLAAEGHAARLDAAPQTPGDPESSHSASIWMIDAEGPHQVLGRRTGAAGGHRARLRGAARRGRRSTDGVWLERIGQLSAAMVGAITIGIDPFVELGPLTLAWHGIMTAVGILVGGWFATRYGRELGLDTDRLQTAVVIMALAGIAGARVFYLVVAEPGSLLRPGEWLGTQGFAIYGAVIASPIAAWLYLRRAGASARYLDALAAGFPLGLAVGRIGDVINGEHYGSGTDVPWAFRYTHPDADVPSTMLANHSGGFYEVLLGLALLAVVWPLRHRFQQPLTLLWTVVGLYGAGRFVMFFYRADSEPLALGLNEAQWTSLALVAVALGGLLGARRAGGLRNRLTPATEKRSPA